MLIKIILTSAIFASYMYQYKQEQGTVIDPLTDPFHNEFEYIYNTDITEGYSYKKLNQLPQPVFVGIRKEDLRKMHNEFFN